MNKEHGQYFISIDNDIIFIKAVGAFNVEGVIEAIRDTKQFIESQKLQCFKLLVDYLDLEGLTPDAFDKLNELNLWLNEQNMVAKAVVIDSPVILDIFGQRSPARKLHLDKNFDNKTQAIKWLKHQ